MKFLLFLNSLHSLVTLVNAGKKHSGANNNPGSSPNVPSSPDPQETVWKAQTKLITQFTRHADLDKLDYWIKANAQQSILDYFAYYFVDTETPYSRESLEGFLAPLRDYNYVKETNAFNDDRIWLALASLRAYDLSKEQVFLKHAIHVQEHVKKQWTNVCGGGVPWKTDDNYKNTITNGLYFQLSAALYSKTRSDVYNTDAQGTYKWIMNSGLYNSNVFHDGLVDQKNGSCRLAPDVYSYQLGPIMTGLVELGLNDDALGFALRSLPYFTTSDTKVIKEPNSCDQSTAKDACGGDGAIFKGIYTRGLGRVVSALGIGDARLEAIKTSLLRSVDSLLKYDNKTLQHSRILFGLNWAGPSERFDDRTLILAMDLFNAVQTVAHRQNLVCIYSDADYKGDQQCFRDDGYYDIAINDHLSSLIVANGCRVTVATDGGGKGKTTTFEAGQINWIGEGLNDQISSLIVNCTNY